MINIKRKLFPLLRIVMWILPTLMLSIAYPQCANARPAAEVTLNQFVLPPGTELVSERKSFWNTRHTFGIERLYGTNNRLEDEFGLYQEILSRTAWRVESPFYKGYGFIFRKDGNKNIVVRISEPTSGEMSDIPEQTLTKYRHLYYVDILSDSPDFSYGECRQQTMQSE